jgi:hypothetical protein
MQITICDMSRGKPGQQEQSMRYQIAFIAAGLLIAAAPVQAAGKNITADPTLVAQTMRTAGFQAGIEKLSNGLPYIQSSSGGYPFRVFFMGCDDSGKACKTVQFFAGFVTKKSPSLTQMNTYTRENRWGRIYIDEEDDPVIEMDVDLEVGGMTPELFKDNLEYWTSVMGSFATFAIKNQ